MSLATLQNIYSEVVENQKAALIVFQNLEEDRGSSSSSSSYSHRDVKHFQCIAHNRAFCQMGFNASNLSESVSVSDFSVLEQTFENCFPSFLQSKPLSNSFLKLFDENARKKQVLIETLKYEDRLVPKDIYTIKVCRPKYNVLVVIIENISEELRAKTLAQEMAEAKEQFVANVSHEIRTPLNGILGYIAMLSDPQEQATLTDYQQNCFGQIYDCSMNLLYIMNDILDFSKLNSDQMQLKKEPFNVNECLENSYDVVNPSAHEKGLESAFYIYPNVPPRINGDFKKLRQILLNLLSNSVKFTNKGRIDTTVEMINDEETNSELDIHDRYTLKFTVEDTGIGISEKDQTKLFKSFSQIDQSNQKIYQGTGLGLIISKKLINLMDGDIWVDSKVGEGSKFIFTIKVEEARAISAGPSEELLELLHQKNVLVVDDHVTNRITIASNLVKWGMKPFVCGSAEEALLYLRGGVMQFDMALIDIRMPKIDGFELAEKIRNIEPSLPLIAISSTILNPKTIHRNFAFYLSKPIKLRQLFNVCVATARKQKRKEEESSNEEEEPLTSHSHMVPPAARVTFSGSPSSRATSPKVAIKKLSVPTHLSITSSRKASLTVVDPEISRGYTYADVPRCYGLKRSILIAEDLATNQRVIKGFLEKMGFFDMIIVENGRDALDAVKVRDFDIIMMDLKMPYMDGFETTKQIRKYYKKSVKHPFIIALTANAIGDIKDKCIRAGMDAYICKPININELARILNESNSA